DLRPPERRAGLARLDGRDDVRERRHGPGPRRDHRPDGRDPGRQVRPHHAPGVGRGPASRRRRRDVRHRALPAALRGEAGRPDAPRRGAPRGRYRLALASANLERHSTTSAWSSSCGRPDTITTPTGPAPSTVSGNPPPCGAYSGNVSEVASSNVVPSTSY